MLVHVSFVRRVEFVAQQAVEAIVEHCQPAGPIAFEIGYDEFDITRRLAAFLILQRSDQVRSFLENGMAQLRLHFRH